MRTVYSTDRQQLFTMGYEGRDINEFIHLLRVNGIEKVVDVREVPTSRKRGFSKNTLQERLQTESIEYIHIKALGSPSHLRRKVYRDKDFDYFFRKYEGYLEKCDGEINRLRKIISEKLSCLLCFERSPSRCHRTSIALRVGKINGKRLKVQHI